MTITHEVLDKLKAPFPVDHIFVRVLKINEEGTRAQLTRYLRHIDVAERLDSIDLNWSIEILRTGMADAATSLSVFTQMRLTILGVSRDNVGEAEDPKSSASDALKRCAMSFGVGRDYYNAEEVWVDYNELTDRGREWTLKDYELAAQDRSPTSPRAQPGKTKKGAGEVGKKSAAPITKSALVKEVRRCGKLLSLSDSEISSWARESADVSADKMDVPQLQKFIGELQFEMRKAKIPV